jgi:hypothetical protein
VIDGECTCKDNFKWNTTRSACDSCSVRSVA